MHYGLIVSGLTLMFCPPIRKVMRNFIPQPGEGPSKEDQAKEYIQLRGVATIDAPEIRKKVWCKADHSGGMYYCKHAIFNQPQLMFRN